MSIVNVEWQCGICKILNQQGNSYTETTKILVDSLLTSHLDYCNSLLYNASDYVINKLKCVQNQAAKLILNLSRFDSATKSWKLLHWLPIRDRIEFKILLIVFKCLHKSGPQYLCNLLCKNHNREGLRSNDKDGNY